MQLLLRLIMSLFMSYYAFFYVFIMSSDKVHGVTLSHSFLFVRILSIIKALLVNHFTNKLDKMVMKASRNIPPFFQKISPRQIAEIIFWNFWDNVTQRWGYSGPRLLPT